MIRALAIQWTDDATRIRARGEASLRELSAAIHVLRVRHRHARADRLTAIHTELARELEAALRGEGGEG